MRRMNAHEASVFREVLSRRCPQQVASADRYIRGDTTLDEFDTLSDAISDELMEAGIGPNGDLNEYGLVLDEVISALYEL